MRIFLRGVIGVLLVALGCGDDSGQGASGGTGGGGVGGGGDGGAATGSAVETFCDATVDAFCDAMFACCTDPATLDEFGGTIEACKLGFRQTCVDDLGPDLDDAAASGLTVLDDARVQACNARLSTIASTCEEPPLFAYFICLSAFHGTVAPGEPCGVLGNDISFVECDDGLCGPDGTCIAYLADGDPCDPANDPAAFCNVNEGQWCNGATSTCGPRAPEGEVCDAAAGEKYQCLSLNCVGSACEAATAQGLCQSGT